VTVENRSGSRNRVLLEIGTFWRRQDGNEVEIVGITKTLSKPDMIWYRVGRSHKNLNAHTFLQRHTFLRDPGYTERMIARTRAQPTK